MPSDRSAFLTRRSLLRVSTAGGFAALSAGLVACGTPTDSIAAGGSSPGAKDAKTSVVIAMSVASEPEAGFNPVYGWGCGEHVHEPLIQSTLVTTTTDLTFESDLATDYSISEDGLTWRFTIRDDVTFSDGTPLTAADVAFTLSTLLTSSGAIADFTMIKDVVAEDATHVTLHLHKPFNALLHTLAVVGIVPEAGYGPDYGDHPIGSGRYLLERWDKGEQAVLVANPTYYGPAPKMQRVVVLFVEEDAALAGVRAGQIDIAYTSAVFADQNIPGVQLLSMTSVDSRGISLPTGAAGETVTEEGVDYAAGNDVTRDIALRRAINLALDRDAAVSNVLNGHGTPAFSVSDGVPWANEAMRVDYDPATAAQLLADAGWADTDGDGVLVKDGVKAAFDLFYAASDSTRQALAADVANQLLKIGIKVTPRGESWDVIYTKQFSDPVLWGWGSNSPSEMYNLLHSQGWGNFPRSFDPVVDAHLDAALAHPQIEDSYEDWQLAQWDGTTGVGVQGSAAWVWLANVDHLYFAGEGLNVARQKPHPHGHGWSLANNVDQWTWD